MRQAILVEPKHIEFKEVAEPKAADLTAHQVLVHIKRIGICGSEIHSYHGLHPATFYPVVQGHEYSGVVVAVGRAVSVCKPGDHITARPQLVCGKCNPCKRGQYNVCEHLRVQAFQADGAAQDFFVVDDDRVAKLPEGMSLDYGAMIEPSAVGAHASNRTNVKDKNVVVSGAGTIGNLIAQFCIARGAKNVLITDVSDLRLAKARECGIQHTLNITKKPLKEAAHELFGEEGYQVGFEVAGVEVSIAEPNVVTVKGPKGTLTQTMRPEMIIKVEGNVIHVGRPSEDKLHKSLHGLTRSLIHDMVVGVTDGFKKELEINGVGYKASKEGNKLVMNLGYSHLVTMEEIDGITIDVPAPNKVVINGIDKQKVGQFAANVRGKRPPEPYKGKGIKYATETIRHKEGKAGGKK